MNQSDKTKCIKKTHEDTIDTHCRALSVIVHVTDAADGVKHKRGHPVCVP